MPENHHGKESVRFLGVSVISTLLAFLFTWLLAALFLDESSLADLRCTQKASELRNLNTP